MPPARPRATADDPKSESATIKDRNNHATGASRAKKNGGNTSSLVTHSTKDGTKKSTNFTTATNGSVAQVIGSSGIDWMREDTALLHRYRNLYNLESPGAFQTPLNAALLIVPGIGRQSPTMAARKKAKRNVQKEQLALSVRKHFNGHAITETEVVVNFLYAVKTQDRSFKVKIGAPKR